MCKINKIIDVNQRKSTFLFKKPRKRLRIFDAILHYLREMCIKNKLCIWGISIIPIPSKGLDSFFLKKHLTHPEGTTNNYMKEQQTTTWRNDKRLHEGTTNGIYNKKL